MADHKVVGEDHIPYDVERSNRNVVTVLPLRDWFAGMAMQGGLIGGMDNFVSAEIAATDAYELADAMLKARTGK